MKRAFTLAEVLITLGIIGVVAAITIPNVIKNYKAIVLESQFKKAYSVFSQATERIIIEELGGLTDLSGVSAAELLNFYQKYMAKAVQCDRFQTCPGGVFPKANNERWGSDFIVNNYKTYNGNTVNIYGIADAAIALQDGTFAIIDGAAANKYITIDINGWKNKPNKLGHDFFMFQIVKGHLQPIGKRGTNSDYNLCSKTSTSGHNGKGCAIKALYDKKYFKNLP